MYRVSLKEKIQVRVMDSTAAQVITAVLQEKFIGNKKRVSGNHWPLSMDTHGFK